MDDADGFMALYKREREAVMVFVARRTLDAALAAEMTAETFALALSSWPRLRGRSEAETRSWLFTVARRQVSRYRRRARVERRAIERLGISLPLVDEDDVSKIEALAGIAELRVALGRELARLSAGQRDAVRLKIVEEHSYEDVARALGITEQAARARVSRGLRTLARALEPHYELREASR
jgi:RNA polymerase sigma-70 factor (ECF subfamily)